MKKFLLAIVATVLMSGTLSAQVAKECVLIEAFTGIGCGYCPAAANGIAQMLEEGLAIAPLAFHNSAYSPPQYATTETNGRATYYNVNSFPTVVIDGVEKVSGGGVASQSMYSTYKPLYDQRINVQSPYTIEMTFDYHSGTECQVKAVVNKVGECDATDVKLYIALTESHIQQAWQGLQELNAVVRDIVTPTSGVAITEDSQEVTGLFSLAGYKKENCQLIAWVQRNNGNKEVYQAVKMPIAEVAPQYDLGITKVEEVPAESCSGKITPRMTFRNYGSEPIYSAVFQVTDGDGAEIGSFEWNGNLNKGQETEIQFEELNFGETGSVKIEAVNLNGDDNDDYTIDNTYLYEAVAPYDLSNGYMKIQLKTGSDPENLSIVIMNMGTGEVLHNLTFDEPNKVYQEQITLPEFGCYRLIVKSAKGTGISSGSFWGIKDENNQTVVSGSSSSNTFRYELPIELTYSGLGVEDMQSVESTIEIYLNPASSVINVSADNMSQVYVYNSVGQLVYSQKADSNIVKVSTDSWSNGMYYISVETNGGVRTSQKVIVNK